MKLHFKEKGFTLIELVIVIVILAVIAALALPRFASLSSEARISALEGLAGGMDAAVSAQHSIALLNENEGGLENGFIANGILFDQGYPVALDFDVPFGSFDVDNDPDSIPEILEAMDIELSGWTSGEIIGGSENGQLTRELYVTLSDVIEDGSDANDIITTNCYVSYDSFLLVSIRPVIRVVTSGC